MISSTIILLPFLLTNIRFNLSLKSSPLCRNSWRPTIPRLPTATKLIHWRCVLQKQLMQLKMLSNPIYPTAHHQQNNSDASNISCFFKIFRAVKEPKIKFHQDLQRVIEKMDLIKQMAQRIGIEMAAVVHFNDVSASAPLRSSSTAMVCSDTVLLGLMDKLTRGGLDLQVIPIVGMGGIGKTTLARNVYECQLIQERFDVCAWTTISQKYNTKKLICDVLAHASKQNKKDLRERTEDQLGLELHKYLFGRRFLIVMDDMWNIDAWEKIRYCFPNNGNGSRILVTTRQLSSELNSNYSLQMEFLDEVSSWYLFCKTVFGDRRCPPELRIIGEKIVKNCRGLPLSIVVVGGILRKMEHTYRSWGSMRNNLTSAANLENDKQCLRLLKLSYNHLPIYLKPCFLYMGMFDEDDEIRVSTIIKLWDSEGFLKPMNDRSLETIARGFIKELVDRNLILVDKLGSTGKIKSCKIHDFLRDLCLNEVDKYGFYHVIGRSTQGLNRQCRRAFIPRNTSKKKVLEDLQCMPGARSLICENGKIPECQSLALLRTFHSCKGRSAEDQSNVNSLAFQCVNLRNLAVIVNANSSFISLLNLFWNLHTLIVSSSPFSKITVPVEIWKMPQFRHIEFPGSEMCLPDPPCGMDEDAVIMKNLRILKEVTDFKCCEEVVKRIPNVRKLKMIMKYLGQHAEGCSFHGDDYYCVGNIKSLAKLESLHVSLFCRSTEFPCLPYFSFPHSLKSLTLDMHIEFEWEEMLEKVGSIPHLEKLKLWSGFFSTGKWEIVEGQFQELKYLELLYCPGLKEWTVDGSYALPRLQQLHLFALEELEEIPCEVGNIATLRKICLTGCRESVVWSAKNMVEEQLELQGEQPPFHVEVSFFGENESLQRLAAPNFTIVSSRLVSSLQKIKRFFYESPLKCLLNVCCNTLFCLFGSCCKNQRDDDRHMI